MGAEEGRRCGSPRSPEAHESAAANGGHGRQARLGGGRRTEGGELGGVAGAQRGVEARDLVAGRRKRKGPREADYGLLSQHPSAGGGGHAVKQAASKAFVGDLVCGAPAQSTKSLEEPVGTMAADGLASSGSGRALDAGNDGGESDDEAELWSGKATWEDELDGAKSQAAEVDPRCSGSGSKLAEGGGSSGSEDGDWCWIDGSAEGQAQSGAAAPGGVSVGFHRGGDPAWDGQLSIPANGCEAEGAPKVKRRPGKASLRRANALDKEYAVMVHKAHLLCLLARAIHAEDLCSEPLLQASLLSLLPASAAPACTNLSCLRAELLQPLVAWVQLTFRVEPTSLDGQSLDSHGLTEAVASKSGMAEEARNWTPALLKSSSPQGFVVGLKIEPRLDCKCVAEVERQIAYKLCVKRKMIYKNVKYICALDVVPLKPDADSLEASEGWDGETRSESPISEAVLRSKVAATGLGRALARLLPPSRASQASPTADSSPALPPPYQGRMTSPNGSRRHRHSWPAAARDPSSSSKGLAAPPPEVLEDGLVSEEARPARRRSKGDEEYERQLAMALEATAAASPNGMRGTSPSMSTPPQQPAERLLRRWQSRTPLGAADRAASASAAAPWSRKMGPILHWAEVFCPGEGPEGRWVHVDGARGVVDCANDVEAATAAGCCQPLRYVLAFAGGGAKDITRRYITRWSRVAPLRVDAAWWECTLAPLRRREADASAGRNTDYTNTKNNPAGDATTASRRLAEGPSGTAVEVGNVKRGAEGATRREQSQAVEQPCASTCRAINDMPLKTELDHQASSGVKSFATLRDPSSQEDVEMEVRELTESLPTSQQAYKAHRLYALERWLGKYQTLHPRGPVLGYCAGQAVYPRECVQPLHTADRWLRELRKVRDGEQPVKILAASKLAGVDIALEMARQGEEGGAGTTSALFGRWQTSAWRPPPAVNGIVPKNSRGQIDVWSAESLPEGTIHLALPRIVPVVRRLGFDFAPAMVGFEVKGGKSKPMYQGVVVCHEHEAAIRQAYDEEEARRALQARRKREQAALDRWRLLIRSLATRQRLREAYEADCQLDGAHTSDCSPAATNRPIAMTVGAEKCGEGEIAQLERSGTLGSGMKLSSLSHDWSRQPHEHCFGKPESQPGGSCSRRVVTDSNWRWGYRDRSLAFITTDNLQLHRYQNPLPDAVVVAAAGHPPVLMSWEQVEVVRGLEDGQFAVRLDASALTQLNQIRNLLP
eukprot:SM000058S18466  [mRNA]  locus=s58:2763:10424:- [translate_table: standard]